MSNEKTKNKISILVGFLIISCIPALAINYSINGNNMFNRLEVAAVDAGSFGTSVVMATPAISITEVPMTTIIVKKKVKYPVGKENKKSNKELICKDWRELEQGSGKVKHCEWE